MSAVYSAKIQGVFIQGGVNTDKFLDAGEFILLCIFRNNLYIMLRVSMRDYVVYGVCMHSYLFILH